MGVISPGHYGGGQVLALSFPGRPLQGQGGPCLFLWGAGPSLRWAAETETLEEWSPRLGMQKVSACICVQLGLGGETKCLLQRAGDW